MDTLKAGMGQRTFVVLLAIAALAYVLTPVTQAQGIPDYEPSAFGSGWADLDGDGCDTRGEVLADEDTSNLYSCSGDQDFGIWISQWDGATIKDQATLDIDHHVPLKEAWESGAWAWTDDERTAFSNDPANLNAVSRGVKQQKGDSDPAEWMPASGATCEYIRQWVEVKDVYGLEYDEAEVAAIDAVSSECDIPERGVAMLDHWNRHLVDYSLVNTVLCPQKGDPMTWGVGSDRYLAKAYKRWARQVARFPWPKSARKPAERLLEVIVGQQVIHQAQADAPEDAGPPPKKFWVRHQRLDFAIPTRLSRLSTALGSGWNPTTFHWVKATATEDCRNAAKRVKSFKPNGWK